MPSNRATPKTIMVATLGGQPQVITFALDRLTREEAISEVYLLHLSPPGLDIQHALARLGKEFAHDQYAGRPCRLHCVPLQNGALKLQDIRTEVEAEATWQAIRTLLAEVKGKGHKVHLCIAGGRRLMGLLAMSAAMLLFDHQDRLWHIYTPDELRAQAAGGAIMHAEPVETVQLIQVPLVPWGAYFPALRAMAQPPQQAVALQLSQLTASSELLCRQVYDRLTERQRATLLAFARGLTPQDVAEKLNITLSTVNTHKTAILAECRIAWQLDEATRLDYRFIRERFAVFLQRIGLL